MKQVTGSNPQQSAKKVSIQLALDGHSFSAPGLDAIPAGDTPVEVEWLTPRTTLLPEELFDAAQASAVLTAVGLAATEHEQPLWSQPQDGIVALMAVNREALQRVTALLGDRARHTTPLLRHVDNASETVWIYPTDTLLYIKVYTDNALRLAEVIPAADDAEILYFAERLATEFPLRRMQLRLSGTRCKELRKLLGKQVKQVLCES